MADYEFRLRFHFLEGDHIDHDAEELLIVQDIAGRRLRLKSGEREVPIKGRSRVALIGGPYASEDEAREAAMRAKRAVLLWAVTHRVGVDLGDGKLRAVLTNHGIKYLERELGAPVRNDVHGIDVYPRQEGLVFVASNFKVTLAKTSKDFAETLAAQFASPLPLSDKQVVAAELFCSSFFDVSLRSRLITLISAVEALLDPAVRPPEAAAVVETLEETVRAADLDDGTRAAMLTSLQRLRNDSIGQTGRSLSDRLLAGKEYLSRSPSRFFRFCYDLRSQIVHNGRPSDAALDLLPVVSACQAYVADLLLASFTNSTSSAPCPPNGNEAT